MKIPNSSVEGDVPKHLVKPIAKELLEPLADIFNVSFVNESWPDIWKVETVVLIPKIPTPGSMNDIRPISMNTFWSKLMEKKIVAKFTLLETKGMWKKNQHGGSSGSAPTMFL